MPKPLAPLNSLLWSQLPATMEQPPPYTGLAHRRTCTASEKQLLEAKRLWFPDLGMLFNVFLETSFHFSYLLDLCIFNNYFVCYVVPSLRHLQKKPRKSYSLEIVRFYSKRPRSFVWWFFFQTFPSSFPSLLSLPTLYLIHLRDSEEPPTTSPEVDVWRCQADFPAEESGHACPSAGLSPQESSPGSPFHHSWI